MPLCAHVLLAAAVLCCFTAVLAFPFPNEPPCRCVRTTSTQINTRQFKRIEILPPGASCPKMEVIFTGKNNSKVCVDPKAQWVQDVVSRVMKSKIK